MLLIFFVPVVSTFAQVDNIPAGHPVYQFLKRMSVSGILKNYDDTIIPLSRGKIEGFLAQLDSSENLSNVDKEFLRRMMDKIEPEPSDKNIINIFDGFPEKFLRNLTIDKQKHLYSYSDSVITFQIDPVAELKYLYSDAQNQPGSFFNFGGLARGSYDNWFGFYLQGNEAAVWGNRNVVSIDKRVEQSYTFNHTDLNYFDGTQGYMRFEKGIVNLQFGRERILWGNGYINKTILSDNPPLFDFVKFGIAYKKFSYNFLHGWLVQKPDSVYVDSLIGNVKFKSSKYIAVSRFGYHANEGLNFGISQIIIYSNRPFEAAYLNPFLFWESAQRSMNDLDNSFLAFDGRYRAAPGCELSASIIFDDINFKKLFEHNGWERSNNGIEWQAGTMLAWPLLPEELSIKMEYTQARPYIFSHPGIGESLTYTNNGYLLGADMQPNSTRLSAEIDYRFSSKIFLSVLYSHTLHGANIYDSGGNLLRNVGGNVFENFSLFDSQYAPLLDGNRELLDELKINFNYEITYGVYFDFVYRFSHHEFNNIVINNNAAWASFYFSFE